MQTFKALFAQVEGILRRKPQRKKNMDTLSQENVARLVADEQLIDLAIAEIRERGAVYSRNYGRDVMEKILQEMWQEKVKLQIKARALNNFLTR